VWLIDELRHYPGALQRVLADLAEAPSADEFLPGARLVERGGGPRVVYGTNDGVRLASLTAPELEQVRCRVQHGPAVPLFDMDGDADRSRSDAEADRSPSRPDAPLHG